MLLRRQVMETGLNMLVHSKLLHARCKAHWNVFDWDKSKKEKEALLISEAIVTTEKKLSYSIPIFN
jgi:hypothetical protein